MNHRTRIPIFALVLGLSIAHKPLMAEITVAGFDPMLDFAFSSGMFMQDARLALTGPTNFGPGGIVEESVNILPDITSPITSAKLSGVDVFITSIFSSYTPDEANAVRDYVEAGGGLIFYGDVGVNVGEEGNSMASAFGITFSTDDFGMGPSVLIERPLHPTIDGPFGTSSFLLDDTGSIVGQTDALTIATIDSGPTDGRAFMVVQDAGTGFPGGRAIWFSDVNILANNLGLFLDNKILFLNTFAYAATAATLSPSARIQALVADVMALNVRRGISNSLDVKLARAFAALDDVNSNNDVAAVNALGAFINEVIAQSGNLIPESDADKLIADTQAIIDLLTQ